MSVVFDMLPVVAGVFMLLFVLLVMLPVPVEPLFEPAFGGVPLTSVVACCCAVVSPYVDDDDAIVLLVVSLLVSLPLSRLRSERQPNIDIASVNRTMRASLVLLLVIRFPPNSQWVPVVVVVVVVAVVVVVPVALL